MAGEVGPCSPQRTCFYNGESGIERLRKKAQFEKL